jgi:DNA invertase Pin-like site-specific DNA recombinase
MVVSLVILQLVTTIVTSNITLILLAKLLLITNVWAIIVRKSVLTDIIIDDYNKCMQNKTKHPSLEELTKLVWEKSLTEIGKDYSVSGNAVKKWCLKNKISYPERGFWRKKELSEAKNFSIENFTKPSKEALEKLIKEKPATEIAKELNITARTVLRWIKSYDITMPPIGYWAKKAAGKI